MNSDALDILGHNKSDSAQKKQGSLFNKAESDRKKSKKPDASVKRPNGMHRELYNLLVHQGKDNKIHSLMSSNTKKGYTCAKAKLGLRRARKWHWKPFINPGRTDGLQLCHWEREGDPPEKIYPFARFNKTVEAITFTDAEYAEYMNDPKWTIEETRNLFELCHRFDLRWPVIDDRFDRSLLKNKKCMEDLKERYYLLVNVLRNARGIPPNEQYFGYDAEHEKRRKEQLKKLWDRTEEQVKEEEELKAALKRIETKRKEREKKAYDLQRLINATERTSVSPDSPSVSGNAPDGSRSGRKLKSRANQAAAQLTLPMDTCAIRFHEFRSSGPHLRTQEMKLPTNIGQKKQKNIEVVIDKFKLDVVPHGMEEIVELYNDFRSNVVILQDLKTALHAAETELVMLNARLQSENKPTMKIEPRMRVSDIFLEANDLMMSPPRGQRPSGAPSTSRRITSWIDVNPSGLQPQRKRRARQLSPSDETGSNTPSRNSVQRN